VGRVDGDTKDDILIGDPCAGGNQGRASFFHGEGSFLVPDLVWTFSGSTSSQLGFAVAAAGDVNSDGFKDILVGAPQDTTRPPSQGRAHFFFGGPEGILYTGP
jgi:hypothetical protein